MSDFKIFSMRPVFFAMVMLVGTLCFSNTAPAQGFDLQTAPKEPELESSKWSFGFFTGIYQPSLETFNRVINNRNKAILQDPNFLLPGNPEFTVEQRNIPSGEFSASPWVGLQTQWQGSDNFALRFSGGVWRGEQLVSDEATSFLRSNLPSIEAPRSARYNLILDQFFLEWRYFFFNEPGKANLSLDLGILGVTLSFLTMDSLVKVVHPAAPNGGFASVSSTEAKGLSYTSRYGLSGEYFIGERFAVGLSAYYVLGKIKNLEVSRHFQSGFPVVPVPEPLSIRAGVPLPTVQPIPEAEDRITNANVESLGGRVDDISLVETLVLDLEGLEVSGYLKFYF